MKIRMLLEIISTIGLGIALLLVINVHETTLSATNLAAQEIDDSGSESNRFETSQRHSMLEATEEISFTAVYTIWLPIVYKAPFFDFENGDCQGWGRQLLNQGAPEPCVGVTPTQEIANTGQFSLRLDDFGEYGGEGVSPTQDFGLRYDPSKQLATAYVYLPAGVSSFPVSFYVQDILVPGDDGFVWHDGPYINLVPGKWNKVSYDMRGLQFTAPCCNVGLHFTPGSYTGPVYIDNILFTK